MTEMKIGPETAVLVAQCAATLMSSRYAAPYDDEQRRWAAREAVLMALAILHEVDAYVTHPRNI